MWLEVLAVSTAFSQIIVAYSAPLVAEILIFWDICVSLLFIVVTEVRSAKADCSWFLGHSSVHVSSFLHSCASTAAKKMPVAFTLHENFSATFKPGETSDLPMSWNDFRYERYFLRLTNMFLPHRSSGKYIHFVVLSPSCARTTIASQITFIQRISKG